MLSSGVSSWTRIGSLVANKLVQGIGRDVLGGISPQIFETFSGLLNSTGSTMHPILYTANATAVRKWFRKKTSDEGYFYPFWALLAGCLSRVGTTDEKGFTGRSMWDELVHLFGRFRQFGL